jgi:hypothetical protein
MRRDPEETLAEMKNTEKAIEDQGALVELHETDKQRSAHLAALEEHEKLIAPYTDGLPYDRDRIISAAKDKLFSSFTNAVECGKYLIWLQAGEGVQTFGLILNEHFSNLSRATAFNFMRLAKISVEHPKMALLADNQRSKALALLEILNEGEIEELENGGIIAGLTLDDVDKIPARQLKEKLRSYKKRVDRGAEQLIKLEEENKALKKALKDDRRRLYGDVIVEFGPEDQKAIEQLHYAHDQMWLCLTAISTIDKTATSDRLMLIARDLCLHIRQLAVETFTEIVEARPDLPDQGETNYWEERLPLNKTVADVQSPGDGKEPAGEDSSGIGQKKPLHFSPKGK